MPRKIRQLKAELLREGFEWRPAKGSHTYWTHPLLPGKSVTLAGNDGADAKPYQERDVREILEKLRLVREGRS
jgi:predicted RNA binding protein YcfA (HicA-like mRNA interferase family)